MRYFTLCGAVCQEGIKIKVKNGKLLYCDVHKTILTFMLRYCIAKSKKSMLTLKKFQKLIFLYKAIDKTKL